MKRSFTRHGYTLIELVAALTAASVIMASLAATVFVSTELLNTTPVNDSSWGDREILDRVSNDLRYSTSFSDVGYAFGVTRPNVTSGTSETANYESYYDGFTRRVGFNPQMQLDAEAPSYSFSVDGHSAPTYVSPVGSVRVRSTSTAASQAPVSSITVEYPAGCKDGDMILMAISAPWAEGTPSLVNSYNWSTLTNQANAWLRMYTLYQAYDSSSNAPVQIDFTGNPPSVSVIMVCVENASAYYGIAWNTTNSGWAYSNSEFTHPGPLEASSGYEPEHLNLQMFCASGAPWYDGTLGLASFTDIARATSSDNGTAVSTIGIAVRNDAMPSMTNTPRVWHAFTTPYLQTGMRLENTP